MGPGWVPEISVGGALDKVHGFLTIILTPETNTNVNYNRNLEKMNLKQKSQASVFLEAGLFQVYPCSKGLAL